MANNAVTINTTVATNGAINSTFTPSSTISSTVTGGAPGATGDPGTPGTNGQGVPTGGTSSQVLSKIDGTDYNTNWVTPTAAPVQSVSGRTGVVTLTKTDVGLSNVQNTDLTSAVAANTAKNSYPSGDATKLAGIAAGATANSSDATLLNRANHTGVQAESTVTNLVTDLASKQATLSLTTTGTSGAATLAGATLNIPQYSGGGGAVSSVNTRTGAVTGLAEDSAVVHLTGAESIAGAKTFSTIPISPTATAGDNSTKVATTAYVLSNSSNYVWKGTWLTSTAYSVNDCVNNGGSSYVCIIAHTSGTFATDLSAGKWSLLAQAGASGSGGATVALDNLASVNINSSLLFNTALTYNVGSSTNYVLGTYSQNLYLNSTAYFNGSTAGQISVTGILNLNSSGIVYVGGSQHMYLDVSATRNTRIGQYSGLSTSTTGSNNVALGAVSMGAISSGSKNMAIGSYALASVSTTSENVGIGFNAGNGITGSRNIAVGSGSMYHSTSGSDNVAIGANTLNGYTTGSQTVGVGAFAGLNNTGSGSVFIGYQAGYNETGSNKLYISNSSTATPLIYGDFYNLNIGFNTTAMGGGVGVVAIANAASIPSTTPSGGGVLYVSGGALKFKGSSGTVTTIATA